LDCLHFDDADALSVFLNQHAIQNACMLVKGSRGMRLETAFV
jgi:UDP-N-acetylmuramyl pentapeptide synthase